MKKRILLGIALLIMVMRNAGPVLAASGSVQEWANSDAAEAVINRRLVNEGEIRQHGAEYANAFLNGFAQASRAYEQAFRQGVNDGVNHRPAARPVDHVARAGYQRGFEYGCQHQQLLKPYDGQSPVIDPGPLGPLVAEPDSDDYPVKTPGPDQVRFISRIAKSAQKVGMECDLYPSVIIAQAALESNWGASGLAQKPYHNLFGVKGTFNGHSVKQVTTEYTPEGKQVTIRDFFRWYDNDYQSLHDYAETLADPLYEDVHRTNAHSYREATHALLGKYATDPHYDRKLNRLIDSYQLTKYDRQVMTKEKDSKPVTPVADTRVPETSVVPPAKHHHLSWLSVAGGIGSAGALGLLRRFISIK